MTTKKTARRQHFPAPVFTTDTLGHPIARVHAAAPGGGVWIEVDRAQYVDAIRRGLSPRWCLNKGGRGEHWYVRAHLEGDDRTLVSVPLFLLGDPVDHQVRHIDGNRLNLRADNLELAPRRGSRRARGEPDRAGTIRVPDRDHAFETRARYGESAPMSATVRAE